MLLTRTMNRRPEIGFRSYDRLFPSQDTMPSGGFGNLIALPLQLYPLSLTDIARLNCFALTRRATELAAQMEVDTGAVFYYLAYLLIA
jgi:hypothetical protein